MTAHRLASTLTRFYRQARRTARRHWQGLSVTFRGNRVPRRVDFQRGVPRPILLLQGFGSTRRSLTMLEKRLRADGFEVFSFRLGGLFGTLNTRGIDRIARDVLAKIESLRARYHLGKIAVVGHSKGGLVGRYLVSCLGGSAHIDALITLGTPHQGLPYQQLARLTRWGLAMPSVRQMRPTSRFFRRLRESQLPASVRCISIHSADDHVIPTPLAHWGDDHGAHQPLNIELAGISHTDYLIKSRVYEVIREQLKNRA